MYFAVLFLSCPILPAKNAQESTCLPKMPWDAQSHSYGKQDNIEYPHCINQTIYLACQKCSGMYKITNLVNKASVNQSIHLACQKCPGMYKITNLPYFACQKCSGNLLPTKNALEQQSLSNGKQGNIEYLHTMYQSIYLSCLPKMQWNIQNH